jgi:hypothetical protein
MKSKASLLEGKAIFQTQRFPKRYPPVASVKLQILRNHVARVSKFTRTNLTGIGRKKELNTQITITISLEHGFNDVHPP